MRQPISTEPVKEKITLPRKSSLPVLVSFRTLKDEEEEEERKPRLLDRVFEVSGETDGRERGKDTIDRVRLPRLNSSRLPLQHSLSLTSLLPSRVGMGKILRMSSNTNTHLLTSNNNTKIMNAPCRKVREISITAQMEIERFEQDFLLPLCEQRKDQEGSERLKGKSNSKDNEEYQKEKDRIKSFSDSDQINDVDEIDHRKLKETLGQEETEEKKSLHSSSSSSSSPPSSSSPSLSSDIDSGTFSRLSTPDFSLKSEDSTISPSSSSSSPILDSSSMVHLDKDKMLLLYSLSSLKPEDCSPFSSISPPPSPHSPSGCSPNCTNQVTVNGKCLQCCQ